MSRSRIGLLTAVMLVGVGLAVCLGALSDRESSLSSIWAAPASSRVPDDSSAPSPSASQETDQQSPPGGQDSNAASRSATAPAPEKNTDLADVLASHGPLWAQSHPSITYQIQPPRDDSALLKLLETFKERLDADAGAPRTQPVREPGNASTAAPMPVPPTPPAPAEGSTTPGEPIPAPPPIATVDDLGNHRFEIHFQNSDIRQVLEAISEHAGLNIVVSDTVQGNVTANFVDVDAQEALDAILKSAGFLARQEGSFLYVAAPEDFEEMEKTLDQLATRVYRPNYVTAAELNTLITPLLTEKTGFASVSTASEVGVAADESNVGGNGYAGDEVLLIRDYSAVLAQVDQVIAEVDVKPMQVIIEATILSVKLDDETKMGVSFEFLRNNPNVRFGIGTPLEDLPSSLSKGGLQFAFLDTNLGAFIDALESIQDTNVIATPRVLVLNKHRAEVQIGKSDGYINSTVTETSTSQSVAFLDTGTILRIRPFISPDGLVRMELHPELSTGDVVVSESFTIPKKEVTQVTTNVMVRDGCTVIIGGLIREQLTSGKAQLPLLGGLPFVGPLFQSSQNQSTERDEILILLTPHIVREPAAYAEGAQAAGEFHRRRDVMAEKNSPYSRDHISRQYFRLAQNAWAQGDRERALRYAEVAVHFNPGNRAAIDLRSDIWMNQSVGGHTLVAPTALPESSAMLLDDEKLPTWVLQGLQENTNQSLRPSAPPAEAASSKNITKPGGWR